MGSCIICRRPDPAKVQRMHQPKIKVFGISSMEWVKMSSGRSIFLRIDSPWPRSSATTATPPLSFPSGQELKKQMKSKHSNWRLASTARKQSRRVCRLCPKLLEQEKECSECKSLINNQELYQRARTIQHYVSQSLDWNTSCHLWGHSCSIAHFLLSFEYQKVLWIFQIRLIQDLTKFSSCISRK